MAPVNTANEVELVAPGTVVQASGDGQPLEVSPNNPRLFVIRLQITETLEQQSLELSLWASDDGQDWGPMPLLKFPQRFYRGTTQMVLDLTARPQVRFIRARWDVNRWGRVRPVPRFRFGVTARPVKQAKG